MWIVIKQIQVIPKTESTYSDRSICWYRFFYIYNLLQFLWRTYTSQTCCRHSTDWMSWLSNFCDILHTTSVLKKLMERVSIGGLFLLYLIQQSSCINRYKYYIYAIFLDVSLEEKRNYKKNKTRVKYVRHIFSNKIEPDNDKITRVFEWPKPSSREEVC